MERIVSASCAVLSDPVPRTSAELTWEFLNRVRFRVLGFRVQGIAESPSKAQRSTNARNSKYAREVSAGTLRGQIDESRVYRDFSEIGCHAKPCVACPTLK